MLREPLTFAMAFIWAVLFALLAFAGVTALLGG